MKLHELSTRNVYLKQSIDSNDKRILMLEKWDAKVSMNLKHKKR